MNIGEKLIKLNENNDKHYLIKLYLLMCCKKHAKYRSSGNLTKGLNVAKKYIKGHATWKQIHDYEWLLEGEAFGIGFYESGEFGIKFSIDQYMLNDLKKIRICERLSHKKAIQYLEDLAYFIDAVFCYCSNESNGLPNIDYSQFYNKELYNRYFNK